MKVLVDEHDEDKSGDLNAQELLKCIKAYSISRQWTSEAIFPSEIELQMILDAAGEWILNLQKEPGRH